MLSRSLAIDAMVGPAKYHCRRQHYQQKLSAGISVVGGDKIAIENNTVKGTLAAGIYVASEGTHDMLGSTNISVSASSVIDCVRANDVGHALITIAGQRGFAVDNVTVADCAVKGAGGALCVGGILATIFTNHVKITGNSIADCNGAGITTGGENTIVDQNDISNTAGAGVVVTASATGEQIIRGNHIKSVAKHGLARAVYIDNAQGLRHGEVSGTRIISGVTVYSGQEIFTMLPQGVVRFTDNEIDGVRLPD